MNNLHLRIGSEANRPSCPRDLAKKQRTTPGDIRVPNGVVASGKFDVQDDDLTAVHDPETSILANPRHDD